MISIQNVYMQYPLPRRYIDYLKSPFKIKKQIALKNICLDIKSGDRVAFLGANGAGKTTLLKLVGGLLYPSQGHILVNRFNTVKDNLKARNSVGFVLNEERSFYWRLTGIQNLMFFGALDNLHGNNLNEKIKEVIQLVGLNEAGNRLFAGYSSGMRQRLAIARGLLSNPDILILDEPTRTLDPISAEDIKQILTERIHYGNEKTMLIATHRLDEAEELCNKVCFMKKGMILAFGNTKELIEIYGSLTDSYKKLNSN
jgi:ABC-2 type transport system ATP-binding protein